MLPLAPLSFVLSTIVALFCINTLSGDSNRLEGTWATDESGVSAQYTFYESEDFVIRSEKAEDGEEQPREQWGTYSVLSDSELKMETGGEINVYDYSVRGDELTIGNIELNKID